ncbi:MAG: hypothetical protein GYA57_09105, partial [Myxococcales bacterium]|nr:hypothetical protein [Myxococcales bacterium]
MKSVAILLDGGFVRHKLYRALARQHATSKDIMRFVQACLRPADEELFRIYYYGWALKRKATQELLK